MIKNIMARITSFLTSNRVSEEQMLVWAKTEYGKDWAYAYHQVLPRITGKKRLMSILKSIMNYFKGDGLSREERWLSESSDLVDLERRQKQLIYGTQRGLFDK